MCETCQTMPKHVVTAVLSEPRTGRGQGSYMVTCNWAEENDVTNFDGRTDFCPFCGDVINGDTPKSASIKVIDGGVA